MECEIQRGEECSKQRPPILPQGAWVQWGKNAVYFASPSWGDKLGVYAINPTDASVYIVVEFPGETGARISVGDTSCAILGSRVYVATYHDMWFYDIDSVAAGWKKGRQFSGSRMCNPKLFTLKGYLYALRLVGKPSPEFNHNFQVHFKRGWVSLADPPILCPTRVESRTLCYHGILAISCIGDSKVIIHVSSTHYVLCYTGNSYYYKQHFLCYELEEHGYVGKWSRINLDSMVSAVPMKRSTDLYTLPCRSHLLNGDPLLLTTPDGKLLAFGLDSNLNLKELNSSLCNLNDKLPHNIQSLLLHHVSRGIYRAIAFSKPAAEETAVNFSVFTFEMTYSADPAPFLSAEIISTDDHCCSGMELPLPLAMGTAYTSA